MIDVSQSGHYVGDCRALLSQLPDTCVQACVTSPPYWGLRNYGVEGQLGLEATPDEYVANVVAVLRDVHRVLRADGTLWLNLGDCHAGSGRGGAHGGRSTLQGSTDGEEQPARKAGAVGSAWVPPPKGLKSKDLVGVPWMVAFALRADGWWLRMDVVWSKPNPKPESVRDRPTRAHEYVFLLSKKARYYYYDKDAIAEPVVRGYAGSRFDIGKTATSERRTSKRPRADRESRNARSVWPITPQPYKGAHFATMPPRLAERCILAGSRPGDVVLDPFFGSGTVGMVAEQHGRRWIGFDINPAYEQLQRERVERGRLAKP